MVSKKDVYTFLKQNKLAMMASVSADKKPEAAAMYYGVDEKLNFYFMVGDKTRKFANLKKRPHVAIAITDEYTEQTVQAEGEMEVVQSVKKTSKAIKALSESLKPNIRQLISHLWDPLPPVLKMGNNNVVVFKFCTKWLRWCDFKNPPSGKKGDFFQLMLP